MGKSLIITEKPSVAQEFAKVLNVSGRKDGYIENREYVITWCVGHLVGLVYPESYDMKYKKWKLEDLPFLPQEYKYDVIDSVSLAEVVGDGVETGGGGGGESHFGDSGIAGEVQSLVRAVVRTG